MPGVPRKLIRRGMEQREKKRERLAKLWPRLWKYGVVPCAVVARMGQLTGKCSTSISALPLWGQRQSTRSIGTTGAKNAVFMRVLFWHKIGIIWRDSIGFIVFLV